MANGPKKSSAASIAAAAAAASSVSVPALETGIEAAPFTETAFPVDPAPAIEAAPFVEPAPVAEAVHVIEAVSAPFVEEARASVAETAQVVETVSAAAAEVAAKPFAAVSKILEAPIASLTEAQGKVRELVETGLSETQSKYTKLKSAADEAAQAIETSYATVKNGAVQFNVKALEALTDSANANFDFFKSVFAVKSPSDYVTLQTEFARKQIEMMTAQTKAFGELAQKVAAETVQPIKAQVAKTFNIQ
jgi:phasin